jgi:hypothetical protein
MANMKLSAILLDVRVYRGSDIGSDHSLISVKLRFPPKWLRLPKNIARKESILHYKIRKYSMAMQMKDSTETTRNSKNQQYCFGMEEHQNHNLTGSRRQFVKIRSIYTKERIKNMG